MAALQVYSDQQKYRAWVSERPQVSLFMHDWWLDAVCNDAEWSAVMVEHPEFGVVATLPYQMKKYYGQSVILPPLLCPYLGPWLYEDGEDRTYIKEKFRYWQLMDELASGLPPVAIYVGQWLPEHQDWLPFHWKGFRQTTRYTFVIEDLSSAAQCFDQFKGNIRTNIRKASSTLFVTQEDDLDAFFHVHQQSFARKQQQSPIPKSLLQGVYKAAKEQANATIWLAKDDKQQVFAGVLTVSDQSKVYILVSGVDASLGNIGALNLCYWKIIEAYAGSGKQLDFEGSMLETVAPVFLSFGGKMIPYQRVYRFANKGYEWISLLFNKVK